MEGPGTHSEDFNLYLRGSKESLKGFKHKTGRASWGIAKMGQQKGINSIELGFPHLGHQGSNSYLVAMF